MKRFLALFLALAMLLSVTAVFAEEEAAPASEEEDTAVLLATINGEEIYEDNEMLQSYLESYLEQVEEETPHRMELVQMQAMDMTLKIRLLNQRAQAYVSDEEKAACAAQSASEWAEILEDFMTQNYGITAESTEEERATARTSVLSMLEAQGWTEQRYLDEETEALIYNAYLTGLETEFMADPDLAASEEEILSAFNDRVEEDREQIEGNPLVYELYPNYLGKDPYFAPEGYRGITHVLLNVDQTLLDNWMSLTARLEESKEEPASNEPASETPAPAAEDVPAETEEPAPTEEPVTQEMVDQAAQAVLDSVKDKLDAIQEKLAAGTSFEELIAEYGEDPGMADPTNLKEGYAVRSDSILYDANFTKNAFKLEKVGDVGDPFVSQFGVHILCYVRDVPSGPIEMTDDIRNELKSTIESEKQSDAFLDKLDDWMKEADIVYTEAGAAWKYDEELISKYYDEEDAEDDEEDEDEDAEDEDDEDEDEDEDAEEDDEEEEDETEITVEVESDKEETPEETPAA